MTKHHLTGLSSNEFDEFLICGQVIQHPVSMDVYLGIGRAKVQDASALFVQMPFYASSVNNIVPRKWAKVSLTDLAQDIENYFDERLVISFIESTDQKYIGDVQGIIEHIRIDSDLEKLVAVTTAKYGHNNIHPLSRLKDLIQLNGYLYGLWSPEGGILGMSPEPLVTKREKNWQTRSLAGTISKSVENYAEILLSDDKERLEHQLVISDLNNKLNQMNIKTEISPTNLFEFGDIAHLCTEINFNAPEAELETIMLKLSPSAALGAYPAHRLSELKKLNYYQDAKENRIFGGSLGFKNLNDSCALVMIRNIMWDRDFYYIHSGSGIVASSDPSKELQEVQHKREVIERCFH